MGGIVPFGYGERVTQVEWSDRPQLRSPALVCAFKGWNDAGEAATAALSFLVESFDATEVARIDPEDFYDFTAVRPMVSLSEGRTRVIEWPENTLHVAQIAGAEHDLILFEGVEPSLRWKGFNQLLIDAARELGVERVITLGALLADVPHSRPVPMTGIASDQETVERLGFERSTYEGPTGIVGVLHHACAEAGIPSVSLWASVPHYVAAAPNPKAALALIRSFEGVAGVAVEARDLEESAEDYERQVSAAVASDPDVKSFVERLEESMDEALDETPPERLPSADTIARDFQRFLRQRGPETGPGAHGGQ
jgi:predicted ATP-grasp superfamily ATP-dependent carboligase